MYKCKHCGKEFEDRYELTGHSTHCKMNPNYENNRLKSTQNVNKRKEKVINIDIEFICQFCGKKVGNKGCLVIHEKYCFNNPNRILSKREIRSKNKKPKRWTDEEKKTLSEKRKKWLAENPDKHPWKRNSKFYSVPCQLVKTFLHNHNISFVEEYKVLENYNYSVDIAFPYKKIAIEINGNQHYNKDGSLVEYYQKRHDIITSNGWLLFEIPYNVCFNYDNEFYAQLLTLDIKTDDYTKYIEELNNKKEQKTKRLEELKLEKQRKEQETFNKRRNDIISIIKTSNIDFKKYGWSSKLKHLLVENNLCFDTLLNRNLSRYYPEFFDIYKPFIRNGSKMLP